MGISILWFRRDLRLSDHPALLAAVEAGDEVLPVFVRDPGLLSRAGARADRLAASVAALSADTGGALVVRTGDPAHVIPGLAALTGRITQSCDRAAAAGGVVAELASLLRPRVTRLIEVTTSLAEVGATDPEAFLADATEYLEATGHVVIAWIWIEQLLALGDRVAGGAGADAFAAGKLKAAEYFLRRELPIVDAKFDLLAAGDRTTLDMRDDWF